MKNKLLNGIMIGLGSVVLLLMAFPFGMILALAFWIYLGVMIWKKKRVYIEEIEPKLAKKPLKILSVVAGIFFTIAIVGVVMHNLQSGLSETEESLYFFIGIIASYVFILASVASFVIFLKARKIPK